MRHERPEPGRPTPVPAVNARLIGQRLRGTEARRTRQSLPVAGELDAEVKAVVLADMVTILDEARINRGYGDISDLARAGYANEMAAALGPNAAKLLHRALCEQGEDGRVADPFATIDGEASRADEMEAA